MAKMHKLLDELEAEIKRGDQTEARVSKSGVFWHIDHSLRVIHGICKSLQKSDPAEYRYQFNKNRALLFPTGKLPRGVGRAPKVVVADHPHFEAAALLEHLENCRKAWQDLENLPPKAWFKHPVFSNLNLRRSKRFLYIHTLHHLKIIRDIRQND